MALVVSSSRIDLDWAEVTGETGYELQRADGSDWETLAGPGPTSVRTATPKSSAGRNYDYRVAIYGDAESAPSPPASATTLVDPPVSTTLDAVALSPTEVRLGWADGLRETGYRIERSVDGESWISVTDLGNDVTVHRYGSARRTTSLPGRGDERGR